MAAGITRTYAKQKKKYLNASLKRFLKEFPISWQKICLAFFNKVEKYFENH
jgi:hypothetical protein